MTENKDIKILIAEDDFLVVEEIERTLKKSGYKIAGSAPNGKKAVELAATLKPDIVLMDIKMPKMNGIEAAKKIFQESSIPVVILTAHESTDLIDLAGDNGVAAYLTKPPNVGEIQRTINIALARHRDLMEKQKLIIALEDQKNKLEKAFREIKTLRGVIPICAYCKKIQDDEGIWQKFETYITEHSDARFNHRYCPDCLREHFPEMADDILADEN